MKEFELKGENEIITVEIEKTFGFPNETCFKGGYECAADIIKVAMINIFDKLQEGNYKTKMLLRVHDELMFYVFKPELDTVKSLVKTETEKAYKLKVPLDVDLDIGDNWLEVH